MSPCHPGSMGTGASPCFSANLRKVPRGKSKSMSRALPRKGRPGTSGMGTVSVLMVENDDGVVD